MVPIAFHFTHFIRSLLNNLLTPHSKKGSFQNTSQPVLNDNAIFEQLTTPRIEDKPEEVPPLKASVVSPFFHSDAPELAFVWLHFTDSEGQTLHETLILNGPLNSKIHFPKVEVENYFFSHAKNFSSRFDLGEQDITFIFEAALGAPVIIYDMDQEWHLLAPPRIFRGAIGSPFHTKALQIPDYTVDRATPNRSGQFSTELIRVVYRHSDNLIEHSENVSYFGQYTNASYLPHQKPNGPLLDYALPKSGVFKIFKIATLNDHSQWYHLGGELWVPKEGLVLVDNPFPDESPVFSHHLNAPKGTFIQHERFIGRVNFVADGQLTIWDAPLGNISGQKLKNGERVIVKKIFKTINQHIWYQIDPHKWVEAQYISKII